jgi:chromosome segregation ATPase
MNQADTKKVIENCRKINDTGAQILTLEYLLTSAYSREREYERQIRFLRQQVSDLRKNLHEANKRIKRTQDRINELFA